MTAAAPISSATTPPAQLPAPLPAKTSTPTPQDANAAKPSQAETTAPDKIPAGEDAHRAAFFILVGTVMGALLIAFTFFRGIPQLIYVGKLKWDNRHAISQIKTAENNVKKTNADVTALQKEVDKCQKAYDNAIKDRDAALEKERAKLKDQSAQDAAKLKVGKDAAKQLRLLDTELQDTLAVIPSVEDLAKKHTVARVITERQRKIDMEHNKQDFPLLRKPLAAPKTASDEGETRLQQIRKKINRWKKQKAEEQRKKDEEDLKSQPAPKTAAPKTAAPKRKLITADKVAEIRRRLATLRVNHPIEEFPDPAAIVTQAQNQSQSQDQSQSQSQVTKPIAAPKRVGQTYEVPKAVGKVQQSVKDRINQLYGNMQQPLDGSQVVRTGKVFQKPKAEAAKKVEASKASSKPVAVVTPVAQPTPAPKLELETAQQVNPHLTLAKGGLPKVEPKVESESDSDSDTASEPELKDQVDLSGYGVDLSQKGKNFVRGFGGGGAIPYKQLPPELEPAIPADLEKGKADRQKMINDAFEAHAKAKKQIDDDKNAKLKNLAAKDPKVIQWPNATDLAKKVADCLKKLNQAKDALAKAKKANQDALPLLEAARKLQPKGIEDTDKATKELSKLGNQLLVGICWLTPLTVPIARKIDNYRDPPENSELAKKIETSKAVAPAA